MIEQFPHFILEKVLEEKDLLIKLYLVFDESLAKVGIEDRDVVAQMENKFIHCHFTFQQTKLAATMLSKTLDSIRGSFFELNGMGFPSPFLEDDSISMTKQIVERIEEKENDLKAFKDFSDPPTTTNIKGVIHPLAQLLFHCEAGAGLHNVLPHKETIDLSREHENLHNMVKPFEDEWSHLQMALFNLGVIC